MNAKEVKRMNKASVAALVLIAGLLLVTVVYAHFPDGEKAAGFENINIESVKKFQQETLPLRDMLMVKKLELRQEYKEEKPDREKIAEIKKEIIDIRTKIEIKADEAGLPAWIGQGKGRHFMNKRRGGDDRHHCPREW
jgi:hypothetical protein